MKHLKKFEELDFSQTLPLISGDQATLYYSCDDCNAIWRGVDSSEICKYCRSKNIEELSEDEWYEVVKSRSDDDEERDGWDEERESNGKNLYDIGSLAKFKDRKNIN